MARQLTSSLLGESSIKLSGFAMRNMKDSTLNWDPRLSTEKNSTPNTLANSLDQSEYLAGDSDVELDANLRVLSDHLSFVQNL